MHKKLTEILIAIIVIGFGMWLAVSSSALPENLQWFALISLALIFLLFVIFPKIPVDFKIICLLCAGYAFAGKGFAYITPAEPFYIGEIVWCIGMVGYLIRLQRGCPILPTWTHVMMLIWMVTVGLYLMYGYQEFQALAIRDSVIGYYAMFAFFGYAIFSRRDLAKPFGVVLKICIILATLALALLLSGVYYKVTSLSPIIGYYFQPHPDAFLPLIAAGAMYALLEGIRRKSMLRIIAGTLMLLMLFTAKTAGIFAFIILLAYMIVIGRRVDLVLTSSIAIVLAALAVGVLISIDSHNINEFISKNEHLSTFGIGDNTGRTKAAGTTDWRLAWWTIVYNDTIATNPVFGTGLGSDITNHFLESYMRLDLNSLEARNYARYPHNIILTVFGRMGFVGLAVFLVFIASLARILIKVTRYHQYDTSNDGKTLLLALLIVIAGMANGLVQSTYEIPFGAITHWFCIGYVIAYYQRYCRHNRQLAVIN